jgi:hypothetical protein
VKSTSIDQIEFGGQIGNMPFPSITINEFINALAKNGWREAHNAHIYQRLLQRGPVFGLATPNDFARALRDGYSIPSRDGATARVCRGGAYWVIYRDTELITIRHPAEQ